MRRTFFTFLIFIFFCVKYITAEALWQDVTSNLNSREFYAIAEGRYDKGVIYIGTSDGLYAGDKNNTLWRRIFICRGERKGVNHIYVDSQSNIYIATENGLYSSEDLGNSWKELFRGIAEENQTKFVIYSEKDETLYLGTEKGLFRRRGNAVWQRPLGTLGHSEVSSIAVGEEEIFVICNNEVYKSDKDFKKYQKIFSTDAVKYYETGSADTLQTSEERIPIFLINDIIFKEGIVYLSTNKGLFISKDRGLSWIRFDNSGLSKRWISYAFPIEKGSKIFVATEDGVFLYKKPENKWTRIYAGMDSTEVRRLFVSRSGDYIWAICKSKVYRMSLNRMTLMSNPDGPVERMLDVHAILSKFGHEPTINEVQAMAIEYAEVYPEKIKQWRNGAKFRALFPKVNFGLDYSKSDTYEIYTSSKQSYWLYGPEDTTEGWDLNFTWDLADLFWNELQTSIDVRSKLMVQLRDDIVDEVTRLYFERRRLQIEDLIHPSENLQEKLKRHLRIQELTANIDGLTGGAFSAAMKKNAEIQPE